MQKTGCILNTTELAREYNLRDLDGRRPYSDVYAQYGGHLKAINAVRAPVQPKKTVYQQMQNILCGLI
uniref:Dehydrogenase/reductase SDR family member 11 n=1 Tax=Steinernema glaseri TaxID=37863 RepID=A0A1I7ZZP0_9BILA